MRKEGRLYRFSQSLLSRYLLIILAALLFLPIVLPLSLVLYSYLDRDKLAPVQSAETKLYKNGAELENMWHLEALHLQDAPSQEINDRLQQLSEKYSRALIFWVDGAGERQSVFPPPATEGAGEDDGNSSAVAEIPVRWMAAESIAFMKASTYGDPFTVVSFIGDRVESGQGFMVMQIPRSLLGNTAFGSARDILYGSVLVIIFLMFAAVSWLFFDNIRRRLLRLQRAMAVAEQDGFPRVIPKGKPDEIGKLEEAFNTMVTELKDSRLRELGEEKLRKRLISDLSHDLRTPLTVIRSHVYILGKENMSEEGRQSLRLMDERIADLGILIDNLLSYNLLTSGRVSLKRERKDILRLLRESAAAWVPLWEKEGFEMEIELEGEPLYWEVDEIWFRRVLDNLVQNIMRHAHSGHYVGLFTGLRDGVRVIVISDHGPGMHGVSSAKGAGLGLSIVDLLLSRMNLEWQVNSTPAGTSIEIFSPGPQI